MATNTRSGMPDGLTYVSEAKQSEDYKNLVSDAMEQFTKIGQILGTSDKKLQDALVEMMKEQKELEKKFNAEQAQRAKDAEILKQQGASDREILAYLNKQQDIYQKDTDEMLESFDSIKSRLSSMIEEEGELSAEQKVLLRKQLSIFEDSYDLQKRNSESQNKVFDGIYKKVSETAKSLTEGGANDRKGFLASAINTLTGPLRLISDPIASLVSGEKTTGDAIAAWLTREKEKDEEEEGLTEREQMFEDMLSKTRGGADFDIRKALEAQMTEALPEGEEEVLEREEEFFERTNPKEESLLKTGGAVGAGFVYLGHVFKDQMSEGFGGDEEEEKGGLLKKLFGKEGAGLSSLAATIASAAGVAAVAAIPVAMLAGGAALQKRDSEDAKKYAKEGKYGRAAETAILGDRERVTEETANKELGRTTAKGALIGGGVAGIGALTVGGGAAAGMAAGGAAAAGGAGVLGTAMAAGGAALSAVAAPVAIAAAIVAGGIALAKGTQEAYQLEWDKNQDKIQEELTATMLDEDAPLWDKTKAVFASGWKELTGTIAGGIRGVTDELSEQAENRNQKMQDFIQEQIESGDKEYLRLQEQISTEEFQSMNKKDQKMMLQSEGLWDEYQNAQDAAKSSFTENLGNFFKATGKFFSGSFEVSRKAEEGRNRAKTDKELLKNFDQLNGDEIAALKGSDEYAEAIASGQNNKKAMQAAYLAQQHRERDELGMNNALDDYARFQEEQLKQTKNYKEYFKKCRESGMSIAESEKESLAYAEANKVTIASVAKATKDKFTALQGSMSEFVNKNWKLITSKTSGMWGKFTSSMESTWDNVSSKVHEVWEAVSDKFGELWDGVTSKFGEVWESVTDKLGEMWDSLKEGFLNKLNSAKELFSGAKDWITEKTGDLVEGGKNFWGGLFGESTESPDITSVNDAILTKNGQLIELSPDDSVYATKNEPTVIGDRDAQRAMPMVSQPPTPMTDTNIVAMLQQLIEVVQSKEMSVSVNGQQAENLNFDQYRIA